ncbi:unnamed protein product [Cylicocyclus nassatus]|uniref:Uncharacterized protein n=1 Tax=Cylicocyclus nassatus TaxID=53992 RepID=A0AA36DPI0_CYLNA|nr:unnamed protein product [Cylicocyclus nassatus]
MEWTNAAKKGCLGDQMLAGVYGFEGRGNRHDPLKCSCEDDLRKCEEILGPGSISDLVDNEVQINEGANDEENSAPLG